MYLTKTINNIRKSSLLNTFFSKVVFTLLHVVSLSVFNRLLGPELKGQYTYVFNIISVLSLILNLGIYQSFPYYYKKTYNDNLVGQYIFIFYGQSFLYLVIGGIINYYFRLSFIYTILVIAMVLFTQLNMLVIILNIKLRNKLKVILEAFYLLTLIILYIYTIKSFKLLFFIYAAMQVGFIIIYTLYLLKNYRLKIPNVRFVKDVVKFGFLPMLTAILITFNYKIDIFILERYVSFYNIGLYSAAITISQLGWIVIEIFRDFILTKVKNNNFLEVTIISIKVNIIIVFIELIVLSLFGKYVIWLLLGKEFMDSYLTMITLFFGVISMLFFKLIGPIFLAEGKKEYYFIVLFISTFFNVIFNFILIPNMGIIGAALASVISYSLVGVLFLLKFTSDYSLKLGDVLLIKKDDVDLIKKVIKAR